MEGSILERPIPPDEAPQCVVVAGASGGIGSAFCGLLAQRLPGVLIVRLARNARRLPRLSARTLDIEFDIGDEERIRQAVTEIPRSPPVDWVFIATGWLHDDDHRPEKTYRRLTAEHLMHAYRINAIGPALLCKHLIQRLNPANTARIGVLSARVGSISDNRLGGWHSYRASKAALNMLIKNLAIELARNHRPVVVVGLQPGTTATPLSAPFQRNVVEDQLQTPEYTAIQLYKVMQRLRPEDSGALFDFLGLTFAP